MKMEYKQVIVLREDLKISIGKMIAQACHASLEASERARTGNPAVWNEWRMQGAKKVVLKARDLKHLIELYRKAVELDLPCALIRDMGLTEVPPGTVTALGIGPAESNRIDKVTGNLPLLK